MSTPAHHLPEELLLDYAAGSASQPASLIAACHITLCGPCTARLRDMEAVGGAMLALAAGEALRPGAVEAALARLDDAALETPAPPPAQPANCPPLPRPLLRLIEEAGGLRWSFLTPGVRAFPLKTGPASTITRLVRLKPGLEIPLHGHGDVEYTLVFSGALEDAGGRFARGDLCVRTTADQHVQRVAAGEPCIALTVNEGPFLPLTVKGRLMKLLSGD